MKKEIQDYVKRSERHHNIDGVWELVLGFASLCVALSYLRMATVPEGLSLEPLAWLYGFGLGMPLLIYYGIEAIRKRITYPRTGYVRPQPGNPWQIVLLVGLLMGLGLVGDYNASLGRTLQAMVYPAIYAYFFARLDRRKWPVVPVLVLGLLAISMLPADFCRSFQRTSVRSLGIPYQYWALYFAFFGFALLVSGGITLHLYIRRTRPPAEDAE